MADLAERAAEAEERIRSLRREMLGPAGSILREMLDRQDVASLLNDVREGRYG